MASPEPSLTTPAMATTPAAAALQVEDKRCHFLRLLIELRQMIYAFATPTDDYEFRVENFCWYQRNPRRRRVKIGNVQDRIPIDLIAPLAVSRSFLNEALPVAIRTTTFKLELSRDFETILETHRPLIGRLTSVKLELYLTDRLIKPFQYWGTATLVTQLPRLRHLEVKLKAGCYSTCCLVAEQGIIQSTAREFRRMRGLKSFEWTRERGAADYEDPLPSYISDEHFERLVEDVRTRVTQKRPS